MFRSSLIGLSLTLSLAAVAGCGVAPADSIDESDFSLDATKDDRIGNRKVDVFGGVLPFDDTAHSAPIAKPFDRVGFTLRAVAGKEFKVWARDAVFSNVGPRLDTTLGLYGPRSSAGNYPFIAYNDNFGGAPSSILYYTPKKDGIYLVVVSAKSAGKAVVGMNCGNSDVCDWPCAVTRLYSPVCGADGVTYGNPGAAACFDVPVSHTGQCTVGDGGVCKSTFDCNKGLYCLSTDGSCGGGTCAALGGPICPLIYKPVCGCDGNTYGNTCQAASAGASVDYAGACVSCGKVDGNNVLGGWSDSSQSPPRNYSFGIDGTFSVEDLVAPCPEGAQCIWSGIVTQTGKWSLVNNTLQLTYDNDTTNGFGLIYFKQLDFGCDGNAATIVEYYGRVFHKS